MATAATIDGRSTTPTDAGIPKRQRSVALKVPELICRRTACSRVIEAGTARVEATVSLGTSQELGNLIAWEDGATLAFHHDCWKALLQERAQMDDANRRLMSQAASTLEKFDSEREMEKKAQSAADLLRKSRNAICFTGAGLSTSAGLGDYRGKRGKWTLEGRGIDTPYTTVYEELRPTFAHEAVAKLVDMGKIAYVVSQNADGLHHLSGIPYTKLSDVHGSAFTEYCPSCSARYVRETYVPEDRAEDYFAGRLLGPIPEHIQKCPNCQSNHWTGRNCEKCGNPLRDTVISFGDGLEECVLRPAFEAASRADACLSLGSTMSIGPSNQVVVIQRGPLIICVRQDTEMDRLSESTCGIRAWGDCDDFMRRVMQHLLGDSFQAWSASLEEKQASYDAKRPAAGKRRGDIFVMK